MSQYWHRLLCLLRIRDEFDYAAPVAPEVNHPYEQDERLRCCAHCGAGQKHAIHSEPYDERRCLEIYRQHADAVNQCAGETLRERT